MPWTAIVEAFRHDPNREGRIGHVSHSGDGRSVPVDPASRQGRDGDRVRGGGRRWAGARRRSLILSETVGESLRTCCPSRRAGQVQHHRHVVPFTHRARTAGVYVVMELVWGRRFRHTCVTVRRPGRSDSDPGRRLRGSDGGTPAASPTRHRRQTLLRGYDGTVKIPTSAWSTGPAEPGGTRHGTSDTQPYITLEQHCEGECDWQPDIYALGATYYSLLTGQTFHSDASSQKVVFENDSAPTPDPRRVRRDIPEDCADVALRAVAGQGAAPYCNALEMRNALQAILSHNVWRPRWRQASLLTVGLASFLAAPALSS